MVLKRQLILYVILLNKKRNLLFFLRFQSFIFMLNYEFSVNKAEKSFLDSTFFHCRVFHKPDYERNDHKNPHDRLGKDYSHISNSRCEKNNNSDLAEKLDRTRNDRRFVYTESLQGISEYRNHSCHAVKYAVHTQIKCCRIDNFGNICRRDESEKRRCKAVYEHNKKCAPYPRIEHREEHSPAYSPVFFRAVILRAVSRHCHTENGERHHKEACQLSGGSMRNDDIRAECIDGTLKCNRTERNEAVHKSH